jgi:hypothetical protein
MSESSLPPFGPAKVLLLLKTFRPVRLKEALAHLYVKRRRYIESTQVPTLKSRAVRFVRNYLEAHVTNLERATKLEEKAEQLEKSGILSESACNRAERARGERVSRLIALRASFVEACGGAEEAGALDRTTKLRSPVFELRRPSDVRPR